jgi:hypothetical protein
METLTHTEMGLRDAASKRIYIEVALIKSIEARNAVSIDSVLKRLNELRGDPGAASTAPAPGPATARAPAATAPVAKPAPPPGRMAEATVAHAPAATAGSPNDVDVQSLWQNLLEAIGRASPFARSYFGEAHPVSFVKDVFTIGFDPEFSDHIGMVDNVKNHTLIATKLAELGHPGAQVKIVKAERPDSFAAPALVAEPAPAPAPTPVASSPSAIAAAPAARAAAPAPSKPAQLDPNEFKNDPLIKKALEVFKGTIVEVRA